MSNPVYKIAVVRAVRIRNITLRLLQKDLVELKVPKRTPHKHIQDWIEKNRQEIIQSINTLTSKSYFVHLENNQPIQMLDNQYTCLFKYSQRNKVNIRHNLIMFEINDTSNLSKLIKKLAKKVLINFVENISKEIDISFNKLYIKDNVSNWGSCSSKKNINLNYKIIFLPKDPAKYIVVHELCHIVHMNHSPNFWNLVEKFMPNYKLIRKTLRNKYRNIIIQPPQEFINVDKTENIYKIYS
ncbi:MAG: M48 family metallopeptidase [Candidatus Dojkabacteria bacterium]|nr:M48 family metallopeptidase [Candidatus Dojkabacteria bacterium]